MKLFYIQSKAIIHKSLISWKREVYKEKLSDILYPGIAIFFAYISSAWIQEQYLLGITLASSLIGTKRKMITEILNENSTEINIPLFKPSILQHYSFITGIILTQYLKCITTCSIVFIGLYAIFQSQNIIYIVVSYFLCSIAMTNQVLLFTLAIKNLRLCADIFSYFTIFVPFLYCGFTWFIQAKEINYALAILPQIGICLGIYELNDINYIGTANMAILMLGIDCLLYLLAYMVLIYICFKIIRPNKNCICSESEAENIATFIHQIDKNTTNNNSNNNQSTVISESNLATPMLNSELFKYNIHNILSSNKNRVDALKLIIENDQATNHTSLPPSPKNQEEIIKLEGIYLRCGKQFILNDINLKIFKGDIFGLISPASCGKTALLKIIIGILAPTSGKVDFNDPNKMLEPNQRMKRMAYCPQELNLYTELTVVEHLRLVAKFCFKPNSNSTKNIDQDIIDEINIIIERLSLQPELNQPIRLLNNSSRKRVAVAVALLGRKPILIFDDPFKGLDYNTKQNFLALFRELKNEGRTIIISSRYFDDIQNISDKIAILYNKMIFSLGTPNDIKQNMGIGYIIIITFIGSSYIHSYLGLLCVIDNIINHRSNKENEFDYEKSEILHILTENMRNIVIDTSNSNKVICKMGFLEQENLICNVIPKLEELQNIKISLKLNTFEDMFATVLLKIKDKQQSLSLHLNNLDNHALKEYIPNVNDTKIGSFKLKLLAIFMRRLSYYKWSIRDAFLLFMPTILYISTDLLQTSNPSLTVFTVNTKYWLWGIGCGFTSSVYAAFPLMERETKLRNLIYSLGCPTPLYWFGTFCADFLISSIVDIIVIVYLCLENDNWLSPIVITLGFQATLIWVSYFWSFLLNSAIFAYQKFPAFYILVLFVVPDLLKFISICNGYLTIAYIVSMIHYSISPSDLFEISLSIANLEHEPDDIPQDSCYYLNSNLKSDDIFYSLTNVVLWFLGEFVAYMILVMLIDHYQLTKNIKKSDVEIPRIVGNLILDKEAVNDSLINDSNQQFTIKVTQIQKTYANGFKALNDITFGIKAGEIFGFFGPNSSGKSSLFNILLGFIYQTSGTVEFIDTIDHKLKTLTSSRRIYQKRGVCLQYNCLWDYLTVRQHLEFYGHFKGLYGEELSTAVKYFMDELELSKYNNIKAVNLNATNRRKLSIANSLIGNPSYIFLDEPTMGLDPISKRHILRVIRKEVEKNKSSCILFSCYPDEIENVCDKMAILLNGQLICGGQVSKLIKKYEESINLAIYKNHQRADIDISNLIVKMFPAAELLSRTQLCEIYQVGTLMNFSYPEIFKSLRRLKETKKIKDYEIYTTCLKQIIKDLSKLQVPESQQSPEKPNFLQNSTNFFQPKC